MFEREYELEERKQSSVTWIKKYTEK